MRLNVLSRHFTNNPSIDNHTAIELIKRLNKRDTKNGTQRIIQEAFEIYHGIDGFKTHRVIHSLLRLCVRLKQYEQIPSIWNDIVATRKNIHYPLLFKCCVNNSDANVANQCITILQWMRYYKYELQKHETKDHSIHVVKLIRHNKLNLNIIQQIHSLVEQDSHHFDIFVQTALIDAYGECSQISEAQKIFKAQHKKDSILMGVMMKALVKNQRNHELLLLYEEHPSLNNDVTHMYALQSCINNNDYSTGKRIIGNINVALSSAQLQNTIINFYGHFGDLKNASDAFTRLENGTKTAEIANVNVMLKSYVNNGCNKECLSLYENYKHLANDISHTLALKACILAKDIKKGKSIHHAILSTQKSERIGLQLNATLIDFYGQMGEMAAVRKIFDCIKDTQHTVVSIGCMMKTLVQNNCNDEAIALYQRFDHLHNDISHLYGIKACIHSDDFELGKEIHSKVMTQGGRVGNIKLINSLIDFYGHFGDICNATLLFNSVSDKDKDFVSIGSMMNALIDNRQYEDAVSLVYSKSIALIDDTSLALAIKACIHSEALEDGKRIYEAFIEPKQNINTSLSNTLIDFFGILHDVDKACSVFNAIASVDAVSVGALMKTYMNNERSNEALLLYDTYPLLHDDISHTLAIKACKNTNDYDKGQRIYHDKLNTLSDGADVQCYNTLIDFHCHFDKIEIALQIFDRVPLHKRNAQTLNIVMKHTKDRALSLYDEALSIANDVSHLYAIKACLHSGQFERGKSIHRNINIDGNIMLKNVLIEFYGSNGEESSARRIFDSIRDCDKTAASINAMMKYLDAPHALSLYDAHPLLLDDISHVLALKACKRVRDKRKGESIYQQNISNSSSIQLQNALIDFFGCFGDISSATHVFDNIDSQQKDCATVNSMISALSDNELYHDALSIYDKYDTLHDTITHVLTIKTCTNCGNLFAFKKGQQIHRVIPLQEHSIALRNTLIDFYGAYDDIESALQIFDSIPNDEKDIYTIGAMMNAYCNCKMDAQCCELFCNIASINGELQANVVCYSNLFKACTQGTLYHFGRQMHEQMEQNHAWMLGETEIQITLINMYGKCSILRSCDEIFNRTNKHEIGVWNAIIYAYGRNGDIEGVKHLFHSLQLQDLQPDFRTFVALINACSHSGDCDEAKHIWHNINPRAIKYNKNVMTSIIDCYARRGYLTDAYDVLRQYLAMDPADEPHHVTMFMALLSGCNKYQNYPLALQIYDVMNKHFKNNQSYMASAATIVSNMHAANNKAIQCNQV
eukprot:286739_1